MTTEQNTDLSNRPQLLLISIICFASLGYAYYLQTAQGLSACLMCIAARYVILSIGVISLLAFSFTLVKNKFTHFCAKALHILTYPVVLLGIYFVYNHYVVIKEQSNACSISPLQKTFNSLPTIQWWPDFFEVRGNCAAIQTMLHGIPIHFTPLIVYVLFFFFSYVYLKYDGYMLNAKFENDEH